MIVYRLAKATYANDLSGRGAFLYGGRWNSPGVAMIYASESRALSVLEVAVHTPLGIAPDGYKLIELELYAKNLKIYTPEILPEGWDSIPPKETSQKLGNLFIQKGNFLLMKVPSAVVPGDFNMLLNPTHHDMKYVSITRISDFTFDERLYS
jgi:RES domain-containing protein